MSEQQVLPGRSHEKEFRLRKISSTCKEGIKSARENKEKKGDAGVMMQRRKSVRVIAGFIRDA